MLYLAMLYLLVLLQLPSVEQRIFTLIPFKMAKYLVWHILSFTVMVSPLKFFEDANLTDEEFEKYPVVSTEERESEACEGVREVEEVRNVDGEEIRKLSIIDLSNLHTMLEDSKTQGQVEIWHRSAAHDF